MLLAVDMDESVDFLPSAWSHSQERNEGIPTFSCRYIIIFVDGKLKLSALRTRRSYQYTDKHLLLAAVLCFLLFFCTNSRNYKKNQIHAGSNTNCQCRRGLRLTALFLSDDSEFRVVGHHETFLQKSRRHFLMGTA